MSPVLDLFISLFTELSKIESSVDCIAGILSKRKIGNQSTATREPIGIQSQRDRSNNLDK